MTLEKEREDDISLDKISSAIMSHDKCRKNLIPILQMIQQQFAYIPPEAIRLVAKYLEIAVCEVYGVATFYNQFRFNPPGKHPVKVCLGTACHVKGGEIVLENFERKLGIQDGETTTDREFSIDRVACVGCCALAPVALVGENVYGGMTPSKVEGIILGFQIEKEKEERDKEHHGS
jgi:NADH-quinone oxidoreductase subunit E